MTTTTTRRQFLKQSVFAGAGLALIADSKLVLFAQEAPVQFRPSAYLEVTPQNEVKMWVVRQEMGQGVRTSLPAVLADELGADLSKVKLIQASTTPEFAHIRLRTSGSGSAAGTWMAMRRAAAGAREMLVAAAASRLGVDAASLKAENGNIVHAASGRKLSFGELAADAAKLPIPKEPALKDAKDFTLIGKRVKRLDGRDITTGKAIYGMDVRIPGMKFAAVARCPVIGGTVKSFDSSKALQVRGVSHVVAVTTGIAKGVAVVADSTWSAFKGRDALTVQWEAGQHATFNSDDFFKQLDNAMDGNGWFSRDEGDAVAKLGAAPKKLSATYQYGYQAHAPLETMNCTAHVKGDSCEIWVPTQAPHTVQEEAAKLLGIPKEKVKVNITLLGGGFGRRLYVDYAPETVEVSRAIKGPVQVVWSRSDDMKYGYFHQAAVQRVAAGLDDQGKPVAWVHKAASSDFGAPATLPTNPRKYAEDASPWGAFDNFYNYPAIKVDYFPIQTVVPIGPWRAVFYPESVFARECFVDEMAHAAGKDPLDYRYMLLEPGDTLQVGPYRLDRARMIATLKLAEEKSGWRTPMKQVGNRKWGRGIACNIYHGQTHTVQVAEVSVGTQGDVRVHRVVTTLDCGQVLNLNGTEAQVESAVAWGLSATLHGEITFKNGQAQQSSYRDFHVLRMKDAPVCETYVVESKVKVPNGLGEQPVAPIGPAVANAVFAATGKRVRKLPMGNVGG